MTQKCILDDKRKGGCASCLPQCAHRIAMNGLNGEGGRVGAAGLPKEYRHLTLTNSPAREGQSDIYASLERYAATFGGDNVKSVYLWSESPGTGKTTTAASLANEFIARSYIEALRKGEQPAQVLAVYMDANEFQSRYNLAALTNDEDAMKRIGTNIKRMQAAPFAVIDDLGVRGSTEAFTSYLHAIINHRVVNGKPTVFTSNVPIEDLADVFTPRLYDRIRDQNGVIHFKGTSKRGRR